MASSGQQPRRPGDLGARSERMGRSSRKTKMWFSVDVFVFFWGSVLRGFHRCFSSFVLFECFSLYCFVIGASVVFLVDVLSLHLF